MWASLQHPRHIEFYEEFHHSHHHLGDDWQPMIDAVRYLQSQSYAPPLFAFTSLLHFQVTTAPSYAEYDGHHCIGVVWSPTEHQFHLSYNTAGWISPELSERVCEEPAFPAAVDSLIQRLLLQSPEG